MTQMNDSFVNVLNTKTGKTGRMPRRLFEHPVFNRGGILVECEAASPAEGMFETGSEFEIIFQLIM